MKKILLIIIDGLGDEPIPQLKNKTPLEVAKTPNLNFLTKNGICGQVLPFLEKGKLPTSEDTHLALFGYEPKKFNPGRGVLEVIGIGMKILPGDVCLRGNFATLDEKMRIVDRRAGRIEETTDLIQAISRIEIDGVKFLIKKAVSHRIGIIIRLQPPHYPPAFGRHLGKNLSSKISSGDPKKIGVKPLKIKSLDKSKSAQLTTRILNRFLEKSHEILKDHPLNKKREKEGKPPANYILVRGAGKYKKIKIFKEKYKMKACCIAGGGLYKGIGKFLGMDEILVKGTTGLPSTNLKEKILVAKKVLKKNDFVFLHIKAADNLAEDGNFIGKKDFIEKIDENLKPILGLKKTLIVITADHSTCSLLKRHCNRPIPILMYSEKIKAKQVKEPALLSFTKQKLGGFSEKICQKGKLGKIKQIDLMKKILLYNK